MVTLGLQLPTPGVRLASYWTSSKQLIRSGTLIFLAARRLTQPSSSLRVFTTLYCPGAGVFSLLLCFIISSRQVIFSPYLIFGLAVSPFSSLMQCPGPGTAECTLASSSRKLPRLVTCLRLFSPFLMLRDCLASICCRGSQYFFSTWYPSMPVSCWLVHSEQISLGVRWGKRSILFQCLYNISAAGQRTAKIHKQCDRPTLLRYLLLTDSFCGAIVQLGTMKQIITLNFGQTGINISDKTLSLYRKEHGLDNPPSLLSPPPPQSLIDAKYNRVFFDESQNSTFNYRAISIDCDPYSTNDLLTGTNKEYYKKSRMVSSKSGSGGLYSRGYTISRNQLTEKAEETIQKTIEGCDNLQGVIVNVAMLGGASGVFRNVLEKIVGEEYLKKKVVVSNLLFPSEGYANSIVEIYNYCLAFRGLLEHSSLNIPYDNQSLYRICEQAGIENPGYSEINQVIASMQSSLTLSLRANGPLSNNLNEMATNLVCYPRINLVYPSATPLVTAERTYDRYFMPVDQLTSNIFNPSNRLINMHGVENKIAVGLYYRGDVNPFEVFHSLRALNEANSANFKFEQWSPLGLKVGINSEVPLPHYYQQGNSLHYPPHRSCCSLTSAMEFNKLLAFNNYKFDKLFAKRAYVYTYIQEQMEEGEFVEAREDLAALEKDYETWDYNAFEEQE